MTTKEIQPKTDTGVRRIPRTFTPFGALQQEIDRVFDNFTTWRGGDGLSFTPTMEVTETDRAIEVSTELPGIDEKDVDISIANDVPTIRGEKKAEKEEKDKSYRLVERTYGAFERSIMLPTGIDANAITATMSKGVLKLTLPKPAAAQSQKIKITPQ